MTPAALAFPAAVALSIVYVLLAIANRRRMKPDVRASQASRLLAVTLWWPFYREMYDGSKSSRTLRTVGFVLLPVIAAYT